MCFTSATSYMPMFQASMKSWKPRAYLMQSSPIVPVPAGGEYLDDVDALPRVVQRLECVEALLLCPVVDVCAAHVEGRADDVDLGLVEDLAEGVGAVGGECYLLDEAGVPCLHVCLKGALPPLQVLADVGAVVRVLPLDWPRGHYVEEHDVDVLGAEVLAGEFDGLDALLVGGCVGLVGDDDAAPLHELQAPP